MIKSPYLLYLGSSDDEIGIKTSRGMATFRPVECVGEFRHDGCPLTLNLPRLTFDEAVAAGARTLILGIANAGGRMSEALVEDTIAGLSAGLDVASGLHQRLRDEPRIVAAAEANGRSLFDVRDARPDIPVGNGHSRKGKRLLTVGTDCSVGKMYTTLCIEKALHARGVPATFRATGQTGILIAGQGIPLDAVVADFISGAVEQISPGRDDDGWDLIEGQGSLSHPSFAGVSTGLLHGAQADVLVVCHDPTRGHMRGLPHYPVPTIAETIEMNLRTARLTNPEVQVVGIALNTSKLDREQAARLCEKTGNEHGLPCTDPYAMGVEAIIDRMTACSAR